MHASEMDWKYELVNGDRRVAHHASCALAAVTAALPPASLALATYLEGVYGSAPLARLQSWSWARTDVLYLDLLPRDARQAGCTPPLGDATRVENASLRLASSAFYALECPEGWSRCFEHSRMLWRFDGVDDERLCQGEGQHMGGSTNVSAISEHLGWVEVSHLQAYSHRALAGQPERDHLWMDLARGSGLWYWRGRTLTANDVLNCAECSSKKRGDHKEIEQYATASHHETLVFRRRVGDAGQTHPMTHRMARCWPGHVYLPFYKVEIVGLLPAPCDALLASETVCPNLPTILYNASAPHHSTPRHAPTGTECLFSAWNRTRLRWGWPGARKVLPDGQGSCPHCTHERVTGPNGTASLLNGGAAGFRIKCQWRS